jgi:hypothetical protein
MMARFHVQGARALAGVAVALIVGACGTSGQNASESSPAASTRSAVSTTQPTASPSQADVRLVIEDYASSQVRLAGIDARDIAKISGHFDGIAGGSVIVLNGGSLMALSPSGKVTTLGQLALTPDWVGPGTVTVDPLLSRWLYAIHADNLTSQIHLGTPTSDKVIVTLPAPDENSYYQPFAWNGSGVYLVREAVGLGGAHPFLEYHFPLATIDLTTARVQDVSPQCIVYEVLDDSTMICGDPAGHGRIEVRSPSGQSRWIQIAVGGTDYGYDSVYTRIAVSPDNKRIIAARNGAKDPAVSYQMAIAAVASSQANSFGPLDYLPDTWLPDGRLVAHHECVWSGFGGGPCDARLDGTYLFSADGTSHSLFNRLEQGSVVVAYV